MIHCQLFESHPYNISLSIFCGILKCDTFVYTVKNYRDFNGKKLWKCYSKNLLNG